MTRNLKDMGIKSGGFLLAVLGVLTVSTGCRPRRNINNITTNVAVTNGKNTGIDDLHRNEYEVLGTSSASDKSTRVFVFGIIPVGSQKTSEESNGNAYTRAVERVSGCDGMVSTRAEVNRYVVPLLVINVVVRKVEVRGRCVAIKNDRQLAGRERLTADKTAQPSRGSGPTRATVEETTRTQPETSTGASSGDDAEPDAGGVSK